MKIKRVLLLLLITVVSTTLIGCQSNISQEPRLTSLEHDVNDKIVIEELQAKDILLRNSELTSLIKSLKVNHDVKIKTEEYEESIFVDMDLFYSKGSIKKASILFKGQAEYEILLPDIEEKVLFVKDSESEEWIKQTIEDYRVQPDYFTLLEKLEGLSVSKPDTLSLKEEIDSYKLTVKDKESEIDIFQLLGEQFSSKITSEDLKSSRQEFEVVVDKENLFITGITLIIKDDEKIILEGKISFSEFNSLKDNITQPEEFIDLNEQ